MRLTWNILSASIIALVLPTSAHGLSIGAGGPSDSIPVFDYDISVASTLSVPITIRNESSVAENVFTWQLSLSLVAVDTALGELVFTTFANPSSTFLDSLGARTVPSDSLPNQSVFVTDVDGSPDFSGKDILPEATHDLVIFEIQSSDQNTSGHFYLVLDLIDSAWSGLLPPANSFTNTPSSSVPTQSIIAEIFVTVPEPTSLTLCSFLLAALWKRGVHFR